MAARLTEIVIDCADPFTLAPFWAEVLGYREIGRDEEAVEIEGPPGAGPTLYFLRVPEPKTGKNRLHFDVNATDRDHEAEVERIVGLGARRVDIGQGGVGWAVLADPEGNEFCVLQSRVEPLPTS
jgi:hypothetical protein